MTIMVDFKCAHCKQTSLKPRWRAKRTTYCSTTCRNRAIFRTGTKRRTPKLPPDDRWREMLAGSGYESIRLRPSLVPYTERMPDGAREL